jgi:hypothetical protein
MRSRFDTVDTDVHAIQRIAAARCLLSAAPKVREVRECGDIEWRRRAVGLLIDKVVIHPTDTTGMRDCPQLS